MSSFSFDVSVSIQEFGKSCPCESNPNFNITFSRINVGSEVFEVFDYVDWLAIMVNGSVGDKLDDWPFNLVLILIITKKFLLQNILFKKEYI